MGVEPEKWLEPEQALSRFIRPENIILEQDKSARSVSVNRFGFMLGNMGILIPEHSLSEVMRSFKVYPLPNTQVWVQGLTNLRGNLVPVYDLGILFGLSDEPMKHDSLLVLGKGPQSVGLLIDNLPKSRDISNWHALMHTPRLPADLNDYVTEVYAVQEVVWISFDYKAFFEYLKSKVAK